MAKDARFSVSGMSCSNCSAHVEKAVSALDGVEEVSVNLLNQQMNLKYNEEKIGTQEIIAAVEAAGYGAVLDAKSASVASSQESSAEALKARQAKDRKQELKRLWVSIIFGFLLFYLSMGHMMGWPLPAFFLGAENAMTFALTQFLLLIPVLAVNSKIFSRGWKGLVQGAATMDSLIALGSGAATIYGVYVLFKIATALSQADIQAAHHFSMDLYFESAGTILALVALGKHLEARAKGRTTDAIARLMDLSPKKARILKGEVEVEVPVEEVIAGDILIIKTGEAVPVDGLVLEGQAAVDESALTGESLPVSKEAGDNLSAATMLQSGVVRMRATRVGEETTLAKIIQLVNEASSSKAPISKLADQVSLYFVPVVVTIAVLATAIWLLSGASLEFAMSIGISVLVISCPCALGLATPTAIMVGTGKGASLGILYKNAEALEEAGKMQSLVFDKTGTVTEGRARLAELRPLSGQNREQVLQIAASLEAPSEHPLGQAIVLAAQEEGIDILPSQEFRQIPGEAVAAKLNGKEYSVGNLRHLERLGLANDDFVAARDELAKEGQTPLFLCMEGEVLAIFGLADQIKKESPEAFKELKAMGKKTILLTGDNQQTAAAIQRVIGADRVIAEVLPEEKEAVIRELQAGGEKVAMIGDGINDAPALARADIGVAIGAGTEVAIDSADVVLMKSQVTDVRTMIELSQAVLLNIKQNLFWALFYNALCIPLAAGVFFPSFGLKLSPMIAALAMSFSSLFVVFNALRLNFFKAKE